MGNIEAVIFDWAGTTVDYGCFAPVHAFMEAFRAFGIEVTMEEVRRPMGMLKRDHIRTMFKMQRIREEWLRNWGREPEDMDVDLVYGQFEPKLLSILHNYAEPKPYVLETVKILKDRGVKIGSTTGYTDRMMKIVMPEAKKRGYEPDCMFSPDSVGSCGRPFPYMIFKNMEALHITCVDRVIKAGDTVSDILEGVNAGVQTVGVLEGSSILGLSREEYEGLSVEEREHVLEKGRMEFLEAGADWVIQDIRGLADLLCF